uniref:Uncharacterized protein n=1 Tax=Chrysemys picta bellii TaxID=8478 RepID=A0A8C3IZ69_CHRPI
MVPPANPLPGPYRPSRCPCNRVKMGYKNGVWLPGVSIIGVTNCPPTPTPFIPLTKHFSLHPFPSHLSGH